VAGSWGYVLGGTAGATLATIERAAIDADGDLGAFITLPTTLASGRSGMGAVVLGDALYVLGGTDGTPRDVVERATISGDGALAFGSSPLHLAVGRDAAAYAVVDNYLYAVPRGNSAAVLLGDKLYLIGGQGGAGTSLASIEVSTVSGSALGPFALATAAGSSAPLVLLSARHQMGVQVIGNKLYVLGGLGDTGMLTNVEVATIDADNNLGPFSAVPGVSLSGYAGGATVLQNQLVVGSFPQVTPLTKL